MTLCRHRPNGKRVHSVCGCRGSKVSGGQKTAVHLVKPFSIVCKPASRSAEQSKGFTRQESLPNGFPCRFTQAFGATFLKKPFNERQLEHTSDGRLIEIKLTQSIKLELKTRASVAYLNCRASNEAMLTAFCIHPGSFDSRRHQTVDEHDDRLMAKLRNVLRR